MSVIHFSARSLEDIIIWALRANQRRGFEGVPCAGSLHDDNAGDAFKVKARENGLLKMVICYGHENARAYSERYNEDCENAALDIDWTRVSYHALGAIRPMIDDERAKFESTMLRYNAPRALDSDAYEFIIWVLSALTSR